MKPGHGITGDRLEQLCVEGLFRPLGDCVLCEAIMAENAAPLPADGVDLAEGIAIDARQAVAWRIASIGLGVSASSCLSVNDVAMNVSIAGESVNPENKSCRWYTIRLDHLVGVVKAADAFPAGYLT